MPAAIISDYNDHPPIKDVIYVVEDSVNLSAFFDDLLSTYLVQALEHFNGGPHTSVERAWASIGCSTTFTLVLVKSTDWRPDLITTFRGPFTSAKRFFNALENSITPISADFKIIVVFRKFVFLPVTITENFRLPASKV